MRENRLWKKWQEWFKNISFEYLHDRGAIYLDTKKQSKKKKKWEGKSDRKEEKFGNFLNIIFFIIEKHSSEISNG